MRRFLFYKDDVFLGFVTYQEDDQPFHVGQFEPASGFSNLLSQYEISGQSKPSQVCPQVQPAIRRYGEHDVGIFGPGLRLVEETSGELVFEPQIVRITGSEIWWRGIKWHKGRRL
ncbi:MAG: hypothetical protein NZM29_04520 [Nitrospira sp.]|nr:hypothetical protein [Nitrospira sp.]MCX7590724.1 hypothetical protein [Kiritimatiellia bacterium]